MKVSVIGNGRWGSFLAWYVASIGHEVSLYGRKESQRTKQLMQTRQNALLQLPENIEITIDLDKALQASVILVSVPSQNLRGLLKDCVAQGVKDKLFVLCMKGLEIGTGKRLSEVFAEECKGENRCAVWLGPGHVQEFVRGVPNCMVIDAALEEDKKLLVEEFSGELIRFYYGEDLLGNEVGAAAKNVVGIAAGMLDAANLTSLKGALMSRGCREYARLIAAMGGNENSIYGLCHLGDYEATVFSPHSHNRRFGEMFVKKQQYDQLAEGYYTVDALMTIANKTGVDLPITQALYSVLYKGESSKIALENLFSRSLKHEFM